MWFWWHDYFSSKNHIVAVWVDVDYLSAEFSDRGLYLRPQNYVSLGIAAKIYDWIFSWWAKKYWWQERFPIHEIGRIDGGGGFWTGKNVFRIGGNTFHDQKKTNENTGVEKVRNRINCGIPRNSERISQPCITLDNIQQDNIRKQNNNDGCKQYFKSVSRYDIKNAFLQWFMPLSDNVHGSFRMMPPELLHMSGSGLIMYMFESLSQHLGGGFDRDEIRNTLLSPILFRDKVSVIFHVDWCVMVSLMAQKFNRLNGKETYFDSCA